MNDSEDDADDMLTYKQAAAFLNISINTLYSLVHQRRVPHVRLGRRLVRFRRAALREWLTDCTAAVAQTGVAP